MASASVLKIIIPKASVLLSVFIMLLTALRATSIRDGAPSDIEPDLSIINRITLRAVEAATYQGLYLG